jgi:TonB family protein
MINECARAETLAGAIALGEASDVERDAYRRHVATCGGCLTAFGGEREIERVMHTVALARETETWEPDLRGALRRGSVARRRVWRLGLSGLTAALAVSIGIHAFLAAGVSRQTAAETAPVVVANNAFHVTVERRSADTANRPASRPAGGLVVENHVVTLARPAVAQPPARPASKAAAGAPAAAAKQAAPTTVAQAAVPAGVAGATLADQDFSVKPSQHDEGSIASMRTAQAPTPPEGHAESLQMAPNSIVVRDVAPLGGETAIVPRPSSIAYYEGAEGTTAFEVIVDEKGAPVKCSITKPSGYLVLDDSVCKAAMRARYSPRTVNGRPVSGVYRDAFTFRSTNNSP